MFTNVWLVAEWLHTLVRNAEYMAEGLMSRVIRQFRTHIAGARNIFHNSESRLSTEADGQHFRNLQVNEK